MIIPSSMCYSLLTDQATVNFLTKPGAQKSLVVRAIALHGMYESKFCLLSIQRENHQQKDE